MNMMRFGDQIKMAGVMGKEKICICAKNSRYQYSTATSMDKPNPMSRPCLTRKKESEKVRKTSMKQAALSAYFLCSSAR